MVKAKETLIPKSEEPAPTAAVAGCCECGRHQQAFRQSQRAREHQFRRGRRRGAGPARRVGQWQDYDPAHHCRTWKCRTPEK